MMSDYFYFCTYKTPKEASSGKGTKNPCSRKITRIFIMFYFLTSYKGRAFLLHLLEVGVLDVVILGSLLLLTAGLLVVEGTLLLVSTGLGTCTLIHLP